MKILQGNIWDLWEAGAKICITTNEMTNTLGHAVMGAGIAKQAKERFPKLAAELGFKLRVIGQGVHYFSGYRLFTFPTKYDWRQPSRLDLIAQSAKQLQEMHSFSCPVFLPKPGCANGNLAWEVVEPILDRILDARFIIVDLK